MAVGKIHCFVRSWAERSSPYTFLSNILHLFSSFGVKLMRISQLVHQEVRFQCLWFLQFLYGSCRSWHVGHVKLRIVRIH
jgi:hypothetical protein